MTTLWFVLVLFMLVMYVLLDGFDLGAGAVHVFVAKTDAERRMVLKAIGPVWDGNEVWLIAAGGTLFFAFPVLYASSFSGFYLPLMIVLWLLMMRGVSIELRSHLKHPMWATFWDAGFFVSSALLAIFFGAAAGNVIRGVPLDASGFFFEALWTNFDPTNPNPGILDWYTVLVGLLALAVLVTHGANYLVLKTEGALNARARRMALAGWAATVALTIPVTVSTFWLRPVMWANFGRAPWGAIFPLIAIGGLVGVLVCLLRHHERGALIASGAYMAGMMVSSAFALYPRVLPAVNPAHDLTIHNAATSLYGMTVGLVWWSIGMVLAAIYFVFIYRLFRGKVSPEEGHY
ncbi:cytochrome d ubiquinol oxidase subunit II [bacterium]|nr:cytochrome d ubiquinol oxidase subunit II [bacterium]